MRGALVLAVVGACSFPPGVVMSDGPGDDMPDMTTTVTWATDVTSKKGVPANASEWSELRRVNGLTIATPDHLWLMQETSGNLEDSIGTVVLTPFNSQSYGNVVSGWSRLAVGTSYAASNQGFINQTIGQLDGTSYLVLAYVAVLSAPASDRSLLGIGAGTDHRYVAITSTPVFKGTGTNVTPTIGTTNPVPAVHPLLLQINGSASKYTIYTDQEKISVSWTATSGTGPMVMFGNAIIGSAAARYLYGALWSGPNAELADSDVKRLLQGLGWTVTGY